MSLFAKNPSFLGIDFGLSRIKAVELTLENDSVTLSNYGEILVEDSIPNNQNFNGEAVSLDEKMALLLKALLKKMNPSSKTVCVSMPGFSGLISLIELPRMEKTELENAVHFEAQRFIPYPLSEVVLSWDIVSPSSHDAAIQINASSNQDYQETEKNEANIAQVSILMVAALRKEVEKYEHYIAGSGLSIDTLELETFSLVRSLYTQKTETVVLIDIGWQSTNIVLVDDGIVKVNRNVNAGGEGVTRTLAEALSITEDRAEILKIGGKDFLNIKEAPLVFPAVDLILNETKRIMDAYQEKYPRAHQISSIILSGGAAKMKGLESYFSQILEVPTHVGNPWENISYDAVLQPKIQEMGSSYSVAIGLALEGIEVSRVQKK